jgi:hypothetical protein
MEKKEYVPYEEIAARCDERLGELPRTALPWKKAVKIKDNYAVLNEFFSDLKEWNTLGAKLAIEYGKHSNEIGRKLIASNVAKTEEDVNTVMLTGFFHAYGPINDFFD